MRDKRLILVYIYFLFYTDIDCILDPDSEQCDKARLPTCDENQLLAFLANTQIINPESIVELAVDSLEPLCRNICVHLHSLDDYLKKCKIRKDLQLYMNLIDGVKVLRDKLCNDSEFYRRFQYHYHCLHELKNDFEGCNAPADWNEEKDSSLICTDYKNMLDCYYVKAAKVCGLAPATTIKELMKAVVDSVIKIKCSGLNKNPYVKDPMPAAYLKYDTSIDSNKAETVQTSSTVIMLILYFLIMFINQ